MILLLKIDNDNLKKNTFNAIDDYMDQIDQVQKNLINQKVFNKMGLIYENKILKVINEDDFETFIKNQRKILGVPTTTNHKESILGHLNQITSRKKGFYSVINKLIRYCLNAVNNYEKNSQKNYDRRIKKRFDQFKSSYTDVIDSEIISFETSNEYCQCGCSYPANTLYN